MSKEAIIAELQRRGIQVPEQSAMPQQAPAQAPDKQAILAELQRRGISPQKPAIQYQPPEIRPSIFQIPKNKQEQEDIKQQHKEMADTFLKNMRERGAKLYDIAAAGARGEQTDLETIGQALTNSIAGAGLDILGQATSEVIKGAYRSLPGEGQKTISGVGADFLDTKVGQLGLEAIQKGGELWDSFKAENPRGARNIEAIITGVAAGIPIGGKSVAGVTKEGAKQVNKLVGKGIVDVKKSITQRKALAAEAVKQAESPAAAMKAYSNNLYKQVDELEANTIPEATNEFIRDIESLKPRSEKAKILAGQRKSDEFIDRIKQFEGQSISLQEADEIDKILGQEITRHYTVKGLDADGQNLLEIQNRFRNHITNPKKEFVQGSNEAYELRREASQAWSKSKLLEDIQAIEDFADLTDNPATSRKNGYRTLMRNKRRFNSYSAKEKALIKKGAQGGVVANLLRTTVGSRLLSTIVGSSGGGITGVAIGSGLSATARRAADLSGSATTKALQKEIINRKSRNSLSKAIEETK